MNRKLCVEMWKCEKKWLKNLEMSEIFRIFAC